MKIADKMVNIGIKHPKTIIGFALLLVVFFGIQMTKIEVDTDPENMLSEDAPVRVFNNETKKNFSLYDMLVVGIAEEDNGDGVFNPATLKNIYTLTKEIEKMDGVIKEDIIAPSTQDHIEQSGLGSVSFSWLMETPPTTREESLSLKDKIMANPTLKGTMVSENGKAIALYVPLKSKDISYEISEKIQAVLDGFDKKRSII